MNQRFERPSGEVSTSEASTVARLLWLKALFGGSDPDSTGRPLDALADRMTEFFVPKGEHLYQEGEAASGLYFIIEGTIEQGSTGYHHFVAGDVLGFVDAMMERPHAQSALVLEDAIILRLSFDDWQEHLEDHPDTTRHLILSNVRGVSLAPDEPDTSDPHQKALLASSKNELSASGQFVRQVLAVRTTAFFKNASIQACAQLTRRGRSFQLDAGESLKAETLGLGLWVLVAGNLLVERNENGTPEAHPCTPGALLGSLHSASTLPENTALQATSPCEVLCIAPEALFDVMEDHFDVARSAFRYLASHVQQHNSSRDLAAEAGAKGS